MSAGAATASFCPSTLAPFRRWGTCANIKARLNLGCFVFWCFSHPVFGRFVFLASSLWQLWMLYLFESSLLTHLESNNWKRQWMVRVIYHPVHISWSPLQEELLGNLNRTQHTAMFSYKIGNPVYYIRKRRNIDWGSQTMGFQELQVHRRIHSNDFLHRSLKDDDKLWHGRFCWKGGAHQANQKKKILRYPIWSMRWCLSMVWLICR